MNAIGASTDAVFADDGTRQRDAATRRCAVGGEPLAGEMHPTMREIDFSRVNLQYLICARDLAREFPERAGVLLGAPEDIVVNLDALTGTGSALDVSGAKPDAAARSQTRSEGLDSGAARREAETELWESTLLALP